MYAIRVSNNHKYLGDIACVAVEDKEPPIRYVLRLCLRKIDLQEPLLSNLAITPARRSTLPFPSLQNVVKLVVIRVPLGLDSLACKDYKRRQSSPICGNALDHKVPRGIVRYFDVRPLRKRGPSDFAGT